MRTCIVQYNNIHLLLSMPLTIPPISKIQSYEKVIKAFGPPRGLLEVTFGGLSHSSLELEFRYCRAFVY